MVGNTPPIGVWGSGWGRGWGEAGGGAEGAAGGAAAGEAFLEKRRKQSKKIVDWL